MFLQSSDPIRLNVIEPNRIHDSCQNSRPNPTQSDPTQHMDGHSPCLFLLTRALIHSDGVAGGQSKFTLGRIARRKNSFNKGGKRGGEINSTQVGLL